MKVLIVEDDRKLASFLRRAFMEEGHVVDGCRTGNEALEQLGAVPYDLVVLDWMLPERDGLSVCREMRRRGCQVPVLMLTARGETGEKVLALDTGADDYVTKPFHLDELLARARSLVRRNSQQGGELRVGPLVIDERKRMAHVDGARIELTGRELSLLALLARHAGRVIGRAELLSQVWETRFDPGSNVVEVHISKLREKLGARAALIETVRGQGYRLALEGSE